MTGTKYYAHNEEINMALTTNVLVFDENDQSLGEISLSEAIHSAKLAGKDIVLRNGKVTPPVLKIMNYKKDLLKKLFQKLGTDIVEGKTDKSKSIVIATNISLNDLENKKKRVLEILKKSNKIKIYMKVNSYEKENIQKGKLLLMNLANDLNQSAKVSIEPSTPIRMKGDQALKERSFKTYKEKEAYMRKKAQEMEDDDDEDFDGDDKDRSHYSGSKYLMLELESLINFQRFDIDKMVEHTTIDDFIKGLKIQQGMSLQERFEDISESVQTGKPKRSMKFEEEEALSEDKKLKELAFQKLRVQRERKKKSDIFGQLKTQTQMTGDESIDLTKGLVVADDTFSDVMTDFDLLDATLDKHDVISHLKREELRSEIDLEKELLKIEKTFKESLDVEKDIFGIFKDAK